MSFSTLRALVSDQNKEFSDYSLFSMLNNEDPAEHIKVSSFYEVDHSKLPHKSPDQLNKTRVVMVFFIQFNNILKPGSTFFYL